jgi:hypothetical protein
VLYGGCARDLRAPDYPWGPTEAEALREIAEQRDVDHTAAAEALARSGMPTATPDEIQAMTRLIRYSASPGAVEALDRMNIQIDIRNVLPAIRVPALVLHNSGDRWVDVDRGKDLAKRIPGASFEELPIEGHMTPAEGMPRVIDTIQRFLTNAWDAAASPRTPERILATVMFTDIVGSTAKAVEVGDAGWRELLERHHAVSGGSWRELEEPRSTRRVTASSPLLTARRGPSRARVPRPRP